MYQVLEEVIVYSLPNKVETKYGQVFKYNQKKHRVRFL